MNRTLRYLASWFCSAVCLALVVSTGAAQHTIKTPSGKTYHTGRKPLPPEIMKRLAEAAKQRHGNLIARLPKVTAAAFDSRTMGWIPPIRDQSQCGSCWDFSGSGVVGVALVKAGQIPNTNNQPSEQYTLDCGQNGGCGGDDNITVLQWAKATGLPLDKDYGVAYQARAGRCQSTSSMKLYKLQDWGFCDPNNQNGVASVDSIKKAIVAYGAVGLGIDAGVLGDGTGIVSGSGHSIDHDVIVVGWDDSKGKNGVWIMRNSWGTGWGQACGGTESGYCYIEYGSGDIGTEACWAVAASAKPPNPWVFGPQAALELPRPGGVACCGNQPEQAGAVQTYTARFTTFSDRTSGTYGGPFVGIQATLPQPLPKGEYDVVMTPVQSQAKPYPQTNCYCSNDPKDCSCSAGLCECSNGQSCRQACDCSAIYRDPQTMRRWRYVSPAGEWEWLPETPPPVVYPTLGAGFVPPRALGGGFSMMRGGC